MRRIFIFDQNSSIDYRYSYGKIYNANILNFRMPFAGLDVVGTACQRLALDRLGRGKGVQLILKTGIQEGQIMHWFPLTTREKIDVNNLISDYAITIIGENLIFSLSMNKT